MLTNILFSFFYKNEDDYFTPLNHISIHVSVKILQSQRRSSSFRVRRLGSQEVKKDIDGSESKGSEKIFESKGSEKTSESKESEEISKIKKTMESHMIVATLIATVSFAAVFTLPGGYIQNEGNNQGMTVLSLPTNGTKGKDQDTAIAMRKNFKLFVKADIIATGYSLCAIFFYFLAAFPRLKKRFLWLFLISGYVYTLIAMCAMAYAFVKALHTVVNDPSLVGGSSDHLLLAPLVLGFIFPIFVFIADRQTPASAADSSPL